MVLDFLIEVGCEEIPAQYVEPLLVQLGQKFREVLARNALEFEKLDEFATPRRLILHVPALSSSQPDRTEVATGPPVSVGLDENLQPTQAAVGFARKFGVTAAELIRFNTEKGDYLGYKNKLPGKSAREILGREIPALFESLELPKTMHWEASGYMFVRPIRWVLCLLGNEVLDLILADVRSGSTTYGHRILSGNSPLRCNDFAGYEAGLLENGVVFDHRIRGKQIEEMLSAAAAKAGGRLVPDPNLLHTVVHLNEHPTVVCGIFDSTYLGIPREVLVTVMRQHQKYFSLQDENGCLLAKFLAVVDSKTAHHSTIVRGHERVLRARLADADFFWKQDRKLKLEDRVERLKQIVFQAELGTLYEKTRRVGQLSLFMATQLGMSDLKGDLILAAHLFKTDLTTEMVKEFTNLQGIMGGLYAKAENLPPTVAEAIYDHYAPIGLEDASPRNMAGAILSISDKLDSVVAAFSIGNVPTGSRDPLGLRKQTIGIAKILLDKGLSISMRKLVHRSFKLLGRFTRRSFEETYFDYESFFKERLKYIFREQGYRYDEINAIVAGGVDNPVDCWERLKAISLMRASEDFASLATSFKRIKNILVKAGASLTDPSPVTPSLFQQEEERTLYLTVDKIRPKIWKLARSGQYSRVFDLMAGLRPQVDQFFEKVLVMAEDPILQKNRLGIIGSLLQIFLAVADISEIVVG